MRTGEVGGSPEIHEKIYDATGRGVVCLFASTSGVYTYVTENVVSREGFWHNDGVTVRFDTQNRAVIEATFERGQFAKLVLFGVS